MNCPFLGFGAGTLSYQLLLSFSALTGISLFKKTMNIMYDQELTAFSFLISGKLFPLLNSIF